MQVISRDGDEVVMETEDDTTTTEIAQLRNEMHAASLYSTEEKLPVTKICKKLQDARDACFTVTFNAKVDET